MSPKTEKTCLLLTCSPLPEQNPPAATRRRTRPTLPNRCTDATHFYRIHRVQPGQNGALVSTFPTQVPEWFRSTRGESCPANARPEHDTHRCLHHQNRARLLTGVTQSAKCRYFCHPVVDAENRQCRPDSSAFPQIASRARGTHHPTPPWGAAVQISVSNASHPPCFSDCFFRMTAPTFRTGTPACRQSPLKSRRAARILASARLPIFRSTYFSRSLLVREPIFLVRVRPEKCNKPFDPG